MRFPLGNVDEGGNTPAEVQQRMEFHRGLALAKARPGEQREAEVDRRRIEDVGRLRQFDPEVVPGIQVPGVGNEHLGEVGVDAPVPFLVGIRQRAPGDLAPDARMARRQISMSRRLSR